MMKRILLLAAVSSALVGASTAISATTTTVSITAAGFVPKNVTVTQGDTVKWVNNDTKNQQVACATCKFTSPVLKPTDSYSYTFNTVGKFNITDPLSNKIKGVVTVKAPGATVSLTAKPGTVKYLAATTLSGTYSTQQANQSVTLLGKACGAKAFTKITTAKTGTGGTFSITDKPTMNTAYQAKVGTVTSKNVTVKVQPTIQLTKLGHRKFSVAVSAATTFAGKQVLFQKRTSNGHFLTVKKVTLSATTTSGTTTVTSKTFKSRIRHHRRVRVSMPLSQTAPCYAASHSNLVRS
jgi:plastocyanin